MNIAARRCCEVWRRAARCRTVAGAICPAATRPTGPSLSCSNTWVRSLHQSSDRTRLLLVLEKSAIGACARHYGDYPAHKVITLPNLSPTMETGSVLSWGRKEGESVMEGDLLAEIETDKATMSMDASESGVLAKILVPAGTKDIPIGTPLCVIVESEADVAAFAAFSVQPGAGGSPSASTAAVAPARPAPAPTVQTSAPAGQSPSQTPMATPAAPRAESGRVFASPLARAVASERGIELASLAGQGTGPGGRIRAADLDRAVPSRGAGIPSPMTTATVAAAAGTRFTDIEITNMRKVIGQRLSLSKQTIPHYSLSIDVRLDRVLALRSRINQRASRLGNGAAGSSQKLSVNDFVIKAAALACLSVPECNSAWHDSFIRQYQQVDMSVAVATERGLITPIVFGAHAKGLAQISSDVAELAARAKQGKLAPHEFQGGTFTVSNLGMLGVAAFSAIINPPQACILAVGGPQHRLELVPAAGDDSRGLAAVDNIRQTSYVTVTLCCDHRVVDGAVGARWLREFKDNLEDPLNMLV